MNKRILTIIGGSLGMMMPMLISSHHYVLVPDKFIYQKGETMQVHLMVGEVFDFEFERELQTGMTPVFQFITQGKVTDLMKNASDSMIPVAKPIVDFDGLGMIVMHRAPSKIEEKPGDFQNYLAEDHVNGILFDSTRWNSPVVNEKYSRHLKSLVLAGKSRDELFFTQPVGLKLELVVLQNPYRMQPDKEIPVRVLLDGKPLPNAEVGINQQVGKSMPVTTYTITDREGMFSFKPVADAVCILHCVYIKELAPEDDVDFESYWSSYSFQVLIDEK